MCRRAPASHSPDRLPARRAPGAACSRGDSPERASGRLGRGPNVYRQGVSHSVIREEFLVVKDATSPVVDLTLVSGHLRVIGATLPKSAFRLVQHHSAIPQKLCRCSHTQAASRSTRTRQPSAVEMFTNASSEKRETRPRNKSLIRGCVTPQRLAASTWVQSCRFTKAAICCISSARARRFAACPGVSAMASQTKKAKK